MKVKLLLLCAIAAVSLVGCSPEKVFKDRSAGYQMNYDNNWKVDKNVEIEEENGTYTYNAVFETVAKTEAGEPVATLKVLKEDRSVFTISEDAGEGLADSEDTPEKQVADSLAQRLPGDGVITYQSTTIAGLKGYWIANNTVDETNTRHDVIFALSDDSVYEFYYTVTGEENYELYEKDVNYMLYNFSVIE